MLTRQMPTSDSFCLSNSEERQQPPFSIGSSCSMSKRGSICDMLQDIAIEEFGRLEMVGKLIAQHTSKIDHTSIHDAPIFRVKGGGPHFLDSPGAC